ncbi:uncharacterized protein isoform X2 [Rhodnius prolixus]|uniref:uncharacterized protein isoform X2 n=1 Tax=Rhodnius prolixus TaxID=13249 RepID=UPI003D18C805
MSYSRKHFTHIRCIIIRCKLRCPSVRSKRRIDKFVEPFGNCIIFLHLSGKFFKILLNQRKVFNFLNRKCLWQPRLKLLCNEVIKDPVYAGHFTEIDKFIEKLIFYINLIIHLTLIVLTSFTACKDYLTATETPNLLLPNFKRLSPIQLTNYLLTICGILNQDGRPWTVIIATCHAIMLILVGILTAANVYKKLDDINEFILPLMMWAMITHTSGKFFYLLLNQRKLRNLLDRLEQLRQEELGDSVYAEHFTKADKMNKTILYYLNLNIHLVPVISTAINFFHDILSASETPSLILPIWIPWEHQKSWPYVAAFVTSVVIGFSGATVFATLYSLLVTITLQISALLQVLQAKMVEKKANDKSIFRQHINVLQVLQQFNDLLSGQYCLEILLSSLQPCGNCYIMIKYLKNGDSRWMDCLHKVLLALSATSFLCACGEEINSQVENLHGSAYRGSWYEEQPAARKDLIILMTITSRPLPFQYKRLVTFNLRCFAANFKRLSPIQLINYLLTRCGLLNQDGRPWTVIIATYHAIMLILSQTFIRKWMISTSLYYLSCCCQSSPIYLENSFIY